ncbi:MAG TPA: hypothetical protein O0Y11_05105, partial [Methanocorpusculum sp.]|nr:hypothetical protein [Methanocorpusculum sp.]
MLSHPEKNDLIPEPLPVIGSTVLDILDVLWDFSPQIWHVLSLPFLEFAGDGDIITSGLYEFL